MKPIIHHETFVDIRHELCFPTCGQWRAKPCLAMAAGGFEGISVFPEASLEDSSHQWKLPKVRDSRGKSLILEGARNQ